MSRQDRYHTRQRQAILRALAQASGFLSVRTLHARMRQAGQPVGLTTIYRTLHAYAEAGRVAVTVGEGGARLYRLTPTPRGTPFLVCRGCGEARPIDGRPVREWAAATAGTFGFTDILLVLELAGRCPACQQ